MDIIVKGRHTDVNDRFRRHVDTKLGKVEKLDPKVIRVDVEVSEEHNPRQADTRERIELTIVSRGPVIRAEAAADDRYAALDMALGKLENRLRRSCDRRKVHHGGHGRARLADALAPEPEALSVTSQAEEPVRASAEEEAGDAYAPPEPEGIVPIAMEGDGPVVLREKAHKADPMTIDQALFEMELVGHDFYLFRDKESGRPSVVYRRRGWDYGVIRLIEE
ncbi:ribosome hibernation-promoting factor, HPF/YfiA family [Actinoallomurus iriomotensis]|uniref:Ribosome hibernation promoting factor n=1 Tax=Actinoallomurus iriomotensis TaxID=478107 RepID=A0A9W6W2L4_9ACTN|nr:ribosome-associated translation inhibitor RaiA [Actinoallomurus iriomotensis]GLY89075.1 ribosomal subunit interface protein [Actinoallomurus iriomotensis]